MVHPFLRTFLTIFVYRASQAFVNNRISNILCHRNTAHTGFSQRLESRSAHDSLYGFPCFRFVFASFKDNKGIHELACKSLAACSWRNSCYTHVKVLNILDSSQPPCSVQYHAQASRFEHIKRSHYLCICRAGHTVINTQHFIEPCIHFFADRVIHSRRSVIIKHVIAA